MACSREKSCGPMYAAYSKPEVPAGTGSAACISAASSSSTPRSITPPMPGPSGGATTAASQYFDLDAAQLKGAPEAGLVSSMSTRSSCSAAICPERLRVTSAIAALSSRGTASFRSIPRPRLTRTTCPTSPSPRSPPLTSIR